MDLFQPNLFWNACGALHDKMWTHILVILSVYFVMPSISESN